MGWVLNQDVLAAAEADALAMVVVAHAVADDDVLRRLALPRADHDAVAAGRNEVHVLHDHVLHAAEAQRVAPLAARVGRLLVVALVHAERAAPRAQPADDEVRHALAAEQVVADAVELALLREQLHAVLEGQLLVGARNERTRDPRSRLPVEHELRRARVERALDDLRRVLGVEAEGRDLHPVRPDEKAAGGEQDGGQGAARHCTDSTRWSWFVAESKAAPPPTTQMEPSFVRPSSTSANFNRSPFVVRSISARRRWRSSGVRPCR